MWGATKLLFRKNFIALNDCIRKEGRGETNYLSFYLRKQRSNYTKIKHK